MRSKGHSQNIFIRIMSSPIRALGKARDMYVRSITKCGQNISYGNPMDAAGRFSALSRSHSVATSTRSNSEINIIGDDDFADLMRVASARTLANRIDMNLVLKEEQKGQQGNHHHHSKGLPKSSSVGMAKIDEDVPFDSEGGFDFVKDLYPRSRSVAVTKRNHAVF